MVATAKISLAEYAHGALARPALLVLLSLLAGHIWGVGLHGLTLTIPALAVALSLVLLYFAQARSVAFPVLICFAAFFFGWYLESRHLNDELRVVTLLDKEADGTADIVFVRGELATFPRRATVNWRSELKPGAVLGMKGGTVTIPTSIQVLMRVEEVPDEVGSWVPGQEVELGGTLESLPLARWGDGASERFAPAGIPAEMRAVIVRPTGSEKSVFSPVYTMARSVSDHVENAIRSRLPAREAALIMSMTLGRTYDLSPAQRATFRRTGLMHIFAISGLHTAIVGGLFLFTLRLFPMATIWRIGLLGLILGFFCCVQELRPSVIRASVLLVLMEGQHLLKRPLDGLNALSAIAVLMLMLNPMALWRIDFQMTFLCVAALAFTAPWGLEIRKAIGRKLGWGWKSKMISGFFELLLHSSGIQLMLAPLVLSRFGEISLIAPVANAFLIPFASLLIYTAFVSLVLLVFMAPIGAFLLSSVGYAAWFLEEWASLFAAIPSASIQGSPFSISVLTLFYLLLIAGSWNVFRSLNQPKRKPHAFVPAMALLLMIVIVLPSWQGRGNALEVWFLDVGQGDATLIRTPSGQTILVDAGDPTAGQRLPQALYRRGVTEIDLLVATHADADHIGGMDSVIKEMVVHQLYVGGSIADSGQFEDFQMAVVLAGLPTKVLRRGDQLVDDELLIEVLHPTEEFLKDGDARNDASIVLRIQYGESTLLLTGDAEAHAEEEMIAAGINLRSSVLKCGHHGAGNATGDAFLNAVQPTIAIISCGRWNRFGHPNVNLMERLNRRGIDVFRTDKMGTIYGRLYSDGESFWSTSWDPLPNSASRTSGSNAKRMVEAGSQGVGVAYGQ